MIATYGADDPMVERMLSEFDCVHLPQTARMGKAPKRSA
jgi:hypothetical protein